MNDDNLPNELESENNEMNQLSLLRQELATHKSEINQLLKRLNDSEAELKTTKEELRKVRADQSKAQAAETSNTVSSSIAAPGTESMPKGLQLDTVLDELPEIESKILYLLFMLYNK